jgi:hypothetical protein
MTIGTTVIKGTETENVRMNFNCVVVWPGISFCDAFGSKGEGLLYKGWWGWNWRESGADSTHYWVVDNDKWFEGLRS